MGSLVYLVIISFFFMLFFSALAIAGYRRVHRKAQPSQGQTPRTPADQKKGISTAKKAGSVLWSLITTIFWLTLTVAVFYGGYLAVSWFYYNMNYAEDFSDNQPHNFRGYMLNGSCQLKDNALFVSGTCEISKKTYTRYPWIHLDLKGRGTIDVWIEDVKMPDFGYQNFTMDRRPMAFNTEGKITKYKFDTCCKGAFYVTIGNNGKEYILSRSIKGVSEDRERIYHATIVSGGTWIDNVGSR